MEYRQWMAIEENMRRESFLAMIYKSSIEISVQIIMTSIIRKYNWGAYSNVAI